MEYGLTFSFGCDKLYEGKIGIMRLIKPEEKHTSSGIISGDKFVGLKEFLGSGYQIFGTLPKTIEGINSFQGCEFMIKTHRHKIYIDVDSKTMLIMERRSLNIIIGDCMCDYIYLDQASNKFVENKTDMPYIWFYTNKYEGKELDELMITDNSVTLYEKGVEKFKMENDGIHIRDCAIVKTNPGLVNVDYWMDKLSDVLLNNRWIQPRGVKYAYSLLDAKRMGHLAEPNILPGKQRTSLCTLCLTNEFNIVLLPCRHAGYCMSCGDKLNKCPVCRAEINEKMKVYI